MYSSICSSPVLDIKCMYADVNNNILMSLVWLQVLYIELPRPVDKCNYEASIDIVVVLVVQ